MAREDRYLQLYRGMWRYWRRVPKAVSHLDDRKVIQVALGTRNIEVARVRRDAMESADNQYWTSLRTVGANEQAEARDPPPLKWSIVMFRKTEDQHGYETSQARRNCLEVAAG
ncbi:DUF6538 domain-containing protein [Roseibium sp. TrichSKD4]|uniref:DUF6538 domain-containing protein n=1 Tax=Roseibium sp. TrichSKD4 TaxID=744980 RepID=UPI0026B6FA64